MIRIEFRYDSGTVVIQSDEKQIFKDAFNKFFTKTNLKPETVSFLANGYVINPENKIINLMNTQNKKDAKLIILVNQTDGTPNTNSSIEQSKAVLCPLCFEPCRLELKNYKIKMYDCINKHVTENMKLVNYKNTQMIDTKKIICNNCNKVNLFEAYNHQFFKCLSCNKSLCPICRSMHDKSHIIVNYEQRNYICKIHNEYYIKFCKDCKMNLCFLCENDHKSHEGIFYHNILPNYNEIKEMNNTLKNSINTFRKNIKEITDKLTDIADNMDLCEEINNFVIENYETRNRNYEDLQNMNEINSNIKNMLEELNNVNSINNDSIRLINMLDIYNKIEEGSSKNTRNIIQKTGDSTDTQEPISKEQLTPIIEQMNSSVCEIYISRRLRGTGFFVEFSIGSKKNSILITNNQLLGEEEFKKNTKIRISLNNGKEDKYIKLDEQRKRYTNELTDVTIIEIKKGDDIYDFLDLDNNIAQILEKEFKKEDKPKKEDTANKRQESKTEEKDEKKKDTKENEEKDNYSILNNRFNNESIYILNHPKKNKVAMSYGSLKNINKDRMQYKSYSDKFSSGSPILLLDDNTVIGIHHGPSILDEYNEGTLIIYPLIEFLNMENNLMVIKKTKKNQEKNEIEEKKEEKTEEVKEEKKPTHLNEMDIIYTIKEDEYDDDKDILLFGEEFVENNAENCVMIIDGKAQKIVSSIKMTKALKSKGKLKIKLREKKTVTNLSNIFGRGGRWRGRIKCLTSLPNIDKWDMSQITDMKGMFDGCESLSQIPDISIWDTKNVTDMSSLFAGCELLTSLPNIAKWNTKNVLAMSSMFEGCQKLISLPDISVWDIQSVMEISEMFKNCESLVSLPDISKWNINNVTNINGLFESCESLTSIPDISKWDTKNVTNLASIFDSCRSLVSLPDISKWNTYSLTDISCMFCRCETLTSLPDISKWNIKNVNAINSLFESCESLSSIPDISKWDTRNVTNMSSLFENLKIISSLPDISNWNTKNVEELKSMFSECKVLSILPDISNWNTKNVKDMSSLFSGCKLLSSLPDISKWNIKNVTDLDGVFKDCKLLASLPDISKWNTKNATTISSLFDGCKSLVSIPDISCWDTGKVESMDSVFAECESLVSLPSISSWNTSNVTTMRGMFGGDYWGESGLKKLVSLPDISKWNTSKVEDMSNMFNFCESLVSLPDISKWDVKSVTDMSNMFEGCSSLRSLPDLNKWNTKSLKDVKDMFKDCNKNLKIPSKLKNCVIF